MLIIPAIDLIGGRCVRLSQGSYDRETRYDASPAEMVRTYLSHGLRRIHVVDLDGAKASSPQNLATLDALAAIPGAEIEWGGGLKSLESLETVFAHGARYAVVGSAAARRPDDFAAWLTRFGPDRIVLGADVREGRISVSGWTEDLPLTIDDLIDRFLPLGLSQVICTDISRDGMLQGPATELYLRLQTKYPAVTFTVSGGISGKADLDRLQALGMKRVIVGKAIYEHRIDLKDLTDYAE